MKSSFIIFFLFNCIILTAQIQHGEDDDEFRVFDVGLIAGFNASQVNGDYYSGFYKLGLNSGGIAHINFNTNWSLSFELLFSQKGSRSRPTPNNINTYKLIMNYAEVPVQINYKDQDRLIFGAGFAFGRLFSSKEIINGYEDEIILENNDISFLFGGTFLAGKRKHFGINFRYEGSIISVGPPIRPTAVGLYNSLLSFRGIYYF